MNPVAGAIFSGIILIVLVYSTLDLTGAASRLGSWGAVLPVPMIGGLMFGIYLILKRVAQHQARIGIKGPMYLRYLMGNCLQRTCGDLETMLNAPEIASSTIFNAILLDKTLQIGATDCVPFADIRRQIMECGLKGTEHLMLSWFFQTAEAYRKQELPLEIRQVEDLAGRSRTDLQGPLERLKKAHRILCTKSGDMLALLPPDPKKIEKIRTGYRFTPPTPQSARRIAFALETLAYLKAVRYKNVSPMDHRRYEAAADQAVPQLGMAFKEYKEAWQDLVDAYEWPGED